MGDKSWGNKRADIIRYRHYYLISARSLGYIRMLPLYDVALDDVQCRWRRAKKKSSDCVEFEINIIK